MSRSFPILGGLECYSVITCDKSTNRSIQEVIGSNVSPDQKRQLVEIILSRLPNRVAAIKPRGRGRPATNDITFYVLISREVDRLRQERPPTLEEAEAYNSSVRRDGLGLIDAIVAFRLYCQDQFYGSPFYHSRDCKIDTLLRYYRVGCALEREM